MLMRPRTIVPLASMAVLGAVAVVLAAAGLDGRPSGAGRGAPPAAAASATSLGPGAAGQAFLGVTTVSVDAELRSAFGLTVKRGVLVQAVSSGSAAARAGLRGGDLSGQLADGDAIAVGGDVITRVGRTA